VATIEEAVVDRMMAYTALTTLIAARLYPLVIPQDAPLPAIAYQKISSPKTQAHPGSSHLAHSRFQFTIDAETYSSAKAVATAVKNCWNSFQGTVDGVRIDHCSIENDSDTSGERQAVVTPVVRIDVLMWHYE